MEAAATFFRLMSVFLFCLGFEARLLRSAGNQQVFHARRPKKAPSHLMKVGSTSQLLARHGPEAEPSEAQIQGFLSGLHQSSTTAATSALKTEPSSGAFPKQPDGSATVATGPGEPELWVVLLPAPGPAGELLGLVSLRGLLELRLSLRKPPQS